MRSWGIWLVLFLSGVRHLQGSCLPRFLLFLGSVVSEILSLLIDTYFVLSVEDLNQNTRYGECLSWTKEEMDGYFNCGNLCLR